MEAGIAFSGIEHLANEADLERWFLDRLSKHRPLLVQLALSGGGPITFGAIAAADAPINSVFHDTADGKLKWKDSGGTSNALY